MNTWIPLKRFNWGAVKEALNGTMAADHKPLTDSTHVRPSEGALWVDSPQSSDNSQRIAAGGSGSRAEVHDHGSKTLAIMALGMSLVVLAIALLALGRSESNRDLAEARYVDLVARNQATTDMARLAERNATVAVERSHDLMARTGRIEAKLGIYSTDH